MLLDELPTDALIVVSKFLALDDLDNMLFVCRSLSRKMPEVFECTPITVAFEYGKNLRSFEAAAEHLQHARFSLDVGHGVISDQLIADFHEQIDHLTISHVNVTDVTLFRKIQNLALVGCVNVSDVSGLGGVHTLNLSWCTGITNVSALGRVHTLNLRGCVNVSDVCDLGGVHTLDLSLCTRVTDVSALGRVHTLDLSLCTRVTDVSALGRVHTLNLSGCDGVTDVGQLGTVRSLDLTECASVRDVSALGSVHMLDLAGCTRVTDVRGLGHVHTLNLSGCDGVTNVSALKAIHTLNLSVCDVTEISELVSVCKLMASRNINTVLNDKSTHGTVLPESIHILILDRFDVTDVSGLGHVHMLDFGQYCRITDPDTFARTFM